MIDQQRSGFLGAVGRFFFSPTDPTTLGFMRIMTGLLLLYVHGAYSLDLKSIFGPHAWWDQAGANTQRREAPYFRTPLGWTDYYPTLWVEESPHRRGAVIEFFRNLPASPDERKSRMGLIGRLCILSDGSVDQGARDYGDGLYFSNSVSKLIDPEKQSAQVRQALLSPEVPEAGVPLHVPDFVRRLSPQERLIVWDEVLAFNSCLPADGEKQEMILGWLESYPRNRRLDLYRFLIGERVTDGRNMSLPADPRERQEFLEFLERWGGDTRQATSKGTFVFSYFFHITDSTTMWLLHVAALTVFLLFTVGLWTRVTSVLAWAVSLCYLHRGQLSLFGQDTMQTILLTYLMIAPSGAALSLDILRARYRAARALMGSGGRSVPWAESILTGPQSSWLANFAVRLFQINFCFIYMSSGVSKLKGQTWWEHSAAWLVMANPEFGLIRYKAYEWVLRLLAESRFVMSMAAASVTVFTLLLELGLPILVWTRLRPLMAVGSILLHLGIAIIMGLCVFSLFMFTLVLCYFPAKLVRDRIAWSPGAGRKMTLRFDGRNSTAVKKAALCALSTWPSR